MKYICAQCSAVFHHDFSICEICHAVNERHDHYQKKLLAGLTHPVEQVRMGCIITLANQNNDAVANALVNCAFHFDTQITQNMAIVDALANFSPSMNIKKALTRLSQHRCVPLANYAREKLELSSLINE